VPEVQQVKEVSIMSNSPQTIDDEVLRDRAIKRLKKQSDFKVHLMIYLMVNGFLVVIWAMTGAAFFWPAFPIAGWGIGVVANAWDAYSREFPSESQIDAEMNRLRHAS
jgi:hypothetical protein